MFIVSFIHWKLKLLYSLIQGPSPFLILHTFFQRPFHNNSMWYTFLQKIVWILVCRRGCFVLPLGSNLMKKNNMQWWCQVPYVYDSELPWKSTCAEIPFSSFDLQTLEHCFKCLYFLWPVQLSYIILFWQIDLTVWQIEADPSFHRGSVCSDICVAQW